MAQFDFHATFDDLVEILRDMLEHRGVRIVIPALDGTTSNEPIEHAVIDDDVKAMLRASNSVWLTGPFTPRPLPLEPRKDVPGRFALKMGSCLSLRIGREDARTIWDSTLACQGSLPKFDATELENAFDDVVEGSVRPRLLRCDDGGVRYWITRQVPEARSAGRSLTFGGSRRRSLGMNIRIAHQRIGQRDRAGNQHATGLVSYTRGSRGTVAIAYTRVAATFVATATGDGPEELFIELLEEVGRAATQAGVKIAAGDARIADLLSIDRRFGALRAPPASGEPTTARVPISRRLARLCREFALVHPSPLETEEFRARDDAGKVTLDFYPGSTAYGLEPVVRWTIVTDLAWVRRAGAGQETSALATELRIDPSADLARATLEKVVARLVLDGAVKHRFHGSVRALADAITPACSEIARAPTRAELERALDTGLAAIRTNPEVYHVRADEIRWALAEPLPDPSTACPTKRSKPGVPALATYPHAELFLEALRTPSPSLIVRVRAVGLAGRPFQRRLTGMPFARLLEDVIPFLRSGEPVEIDPNHLVFQFALRDKEMFVEVPIAAVRAIPALNKLLAPSPPPTEGHARATSATPSSTGRPRSVTIAWRRGDAECTAHAHDSGVAWVDERANGLSVQRVVTRLEPALIHRMVRATVERGAAPAWVARRMRRLALEAS